MHEEGCFLNPPAVFGEWTTQAILQREDGIMDNVVIFVIISLSGFFVACIATLQYRIEDLQERIKKLESDKK